MMEKRKNPERELHKKSHLFYSMGLLIAMMLCVSAFEYKVKSNFKEPISLAGITEDIPIPPITIQKPPPPPPKPKIQRIIEVKRDQQEPLEDQPEFIPIETILIDIVEPEAEVPEEKADEPFLIVEDMPEPNGGMNAFYKFINKNLKYPSQARRMGIEGKVFVQFVINEQGELTEIKVIKGIGAGCNQEVERIMKKAPNWKPGKQRGVPVKVRQVLPIDFRLGN